MKILFLVALVILAGVLTPAFAQIVDSITVTTDKPSYEDGDTIFVTGEVRELLSGYPVSLRILAPDGNSVSIAQVDVGSDKQFSYEFTVGGTHMISGTYTIEVLYGTESRSAKTTFTFGDSTGTDGEEIQVEDTTGMLSDGTQVSIMTSTPTSGEKMNISVDFEDSEHVNYDIRVTQNGEEVLNDIDVHAMEGEGMHETAPLSSSDPVEITITFQGYGVNDRKIGPIGEQVVFSNIVPELDGSDNDNNIPPITNDLPDEITITTALGSSAPSCENTVEGCFIPKEASVAVDGQVIFSNTDTAPHTFTGGTPTDGPSGTLDSGLVRAGSSYEWTATAEGEFPYFCMVHPWMTGVIFVGEGTYIPPTENNFDLQITMGNQVYDLLDTATMDLSINGISAPQNVALEVSDPRGTSIISRSFMVDSQGTSFEFKIDENFKTGTYKVVATTNNNGDTVTDTTYFKVKSQYNSFKITSVQVTDQQGNPSNLQTGEMGFIKVNLEANKSITTLVTVNLFDSDLTSIGIGSIKTTLSSGNSEIILSFMIPSDVAVGQSNIYVNAFSDWPSNGGIPLTGEISVTENIE